MPVQSLSSPVARPTEHGDAAPWFRVPDKTAISVEHPCLVKNVDKAIEMLGGPSAIPSILEKDTEKSISLTFHPEDAASRPLLSVNINSNNVLLKITVPKRTGRKRKRGSNDPFTYNDDTSSPQKDAHCLIQSLNDNQSTYEIEPIATIPSSHLWRSMPDFVYSTTSSHFLSDFRSKILPMSYPLIKSYSIILTPGPSTTSTEIIPPPILSSTTVPHNYAYRQNPAVKLYTDPITGIRRLLNTQAAMKVHTWQVQHDTPTYPTTLPASAPPLATQPHNFRGLVYILTQLFTHRPIWTKRAVLNQLPNNAPIFLTRYAIAYVAFAIRSGPWRDTYCRFGIDPRASPEYRKYQSILLQLVPSKGPRAGVTNTDTNATNLDMHSIAYARTWSRSPDRQSHIFTGTGTVPPDGKAWQLCDLHDPLLKPLVDIPDLHIRATCETRYFGWYPNGTQSKIRILLKTKVDAMMSNKTLSDLGLSDAAVSRFADLPEEWMPDRAVTRGGAEVDPMTAYLVKSAHKRELVWASAYRSMCRANEGEVPLTTGRLSKSKPETRGSFRPSESVGDGDEAEEDQEALEEFEEPEGEEEVEGEDLDMAGVGHGVAGMDVEMSIEGDEVQEEDPKALLGHREVF